jgi:WD40 repeat protein
VVAAHSTAVTALCPWGDESNSSSGGVVSGSKDGTIKLWSTALKQLCEFNITTLSSSANGCCPTVDPLIRGLDWHPAGVPGVTRRILLVATQGCEVRHLLLVYFILYKTGCVLSCAQCSV